MLCALGFAPETARAFEAQIGHASLRANLLPVAPAADLAHSGHDLLHLLLQQECAVSAKLALAQGGDLSPMLDAMVELNQLVNLCWFHPQRLHEGGNTVPDPGGCIGDEKHLVGFDESELLEVAAQELEKGIGRTDQRVDHRQETALDLASGIDHVDDEQLRFAPRPLVAAAPLGRVRTRLSLPHRTLPPSRQTTYA
jgi:hypothetical protein